MEIEEKTYGKQVVICLQGKLDANAASNLECKIDTSLSKDTGLVVNLKKLEYISSSGLRVLLSALKKARKKQGDIRLACMQPYVKEVFDIAGFTALFKLFSSEEEAVSSFK